MRAFKNGHLWMTVLFALVMVLMLLAILFAAHTYQLATASDARNAQLRSTEGFFASVIRASDASGGFEVGKSAGPEGDVLYVYQEDGAYETDIYLYKGMLVQESKAAGGNLEPENATPLFAMDTFAVDASGAGLRVTTSQGTFVCTPRSEGWSRGE